VAEILWFTGSPGAAIFVKGSRLVAFAYSLGCFKVGRQNHGHGALIADLGRADDASVRLRME
jgi:hypothetical protein